MRSRYDAIKALNAEVVVVSFGAEMWIKGWQEQTQAPFPLLLDQTRQAYQAYGLDRSVLRSWGLKNLGYYAKALFQGKQLLDSHGEDTNQLGGDFIIDSEGIIRYAHPSRDPTDRPDVEELLAVLKGVGSRE
ncbi:MAG: redoxin domain-containing protein [Anaerolineae bacterium]|nr:redoxin domain-containing protein [Anaerolineae bacterium]